MTTRTAVAVTLAVALACACGDSPEIPRLVPPSDAEYSTLELPEAGGECERDDDCEMSCVRSCIPVPDGPVTCPNPLPPIPPRVASADCACIDSGTNAVCAYIE